MIDPELLTRRIKTWTGNFWPIFDGTRRFDIVLDDKDYKVGQLLEQWECDEGTEAYTGRVVISEILHKVTNAPGIKEGYCVLGLGEPLFKSGGSGLPVWRSDQ
jgi:hypothetical protein